MRSRNLASQILPQKLRDVVLSHVDHLFGNLSSQMTVIIDEYRGMSINEIYNGSEAYLSTRISPSVLQVKVSKVSQENGEKIINVYEGIAITWEFVSMPTQTRTYMDGEHPSRDKSEKRSIHLSFNKKYKDVVLGIYLPHIMERAKAMKEESKVVKLHSYGFHGKFSEGSGPWGSISLNHPSTFDTIAMDPELKRELIGDLDRFLKRRDFYRRVGKAWKRGYLLYGPPGTGKSSLIAAMANYLKFDIYDLALTDIYSNSDLRGILTGTGNHSMLVIEDIDCSMGLQNRTCGDFDQRNSQLTLSGLLNFVDGLWSSCGDGRIIVFTTNYKDKLDPALLRPGRMDMHIHMSSCAPSGFMILVSNYLSLKSHPLFPEIEELLMEVDVTPAEVAEELMKGDDADIVLSRLVGLLQQRKMQKQEGVAIEGEDEDVEEEAERAKKHEQNTRKRYKQFKESFEDPHDMY